MSKDMDVFLENECMKVIIDLERKFPNDMDLGIAIRTFVRSAKTNLSLNNQIALDFNDLEVIDSDDE